MATAHFLGALLLCTCFCWSEAYNPNKKEPKPTKWTSSVPKDVKEFNAAFKKEVRASKNLTRLFHIDDKITPSEYYAGTVYLSTAIGAYLGNGNAAVDSLLLTSTIPCNKKKLGDDGLIAMYSNFVARALYKLRALNCQSSHKLAKTYARIMENSYRRVSNEKYPRSKVSAFTIAVLSFIGSQFEVTDDVKNAFIGAFRKEWKLQEQLGMFPDADKELPDVENPDKNPLLKPNPKACHVSKAVRQFHQTFQKAVKSSKPLSDLLEMDPSVMLSKGTEYLAEYQLQEYGVQDAAILADFMSKYIDNETARNHLVSFCGVFIGKYLESELILIGSNAGDLASRYVKILEDSAEFIVSKKNPRSKITAMFYGMFVYLRKLRAFDVSRGKKLAFFYGNEWKCLSGRS